MSKFKVGDSVLFKENTWEVIDVSYNNDKCYVSLCREDGEDLRGVKVEDKEVTIA